MGPLVRGAMLFIVKPSLQALMNSFLKRVKQKKKERKTRLEKKAGRLAGKGSALSL